METTTGRKIELPERIKLPCGRCKYPLVKSDDGCPRCRAEDEHGRVPTMFDGAIRRAA